MPVRKNFLPLLAAGIAVPVLLGGVSIAAIVALKSQVQKVVSFPAIAGAGAGYILARAYKQDKGMQIAASLLGYAGGMLITKYAQKQAEKAEEQAKADYLAKFDLFSPSTWFAA